MTYVFMGNVCGSFLMQLWIVFQQHMVCSSVLSVVYTASGGQITHDALLFQTLIFKIGMNQSINKYHVVTNIPCSLHYRFGNNYIS